MLDVLAGSTCLNCSVGTPILKKKTGDAENKILGQHDEYEYFHVGVKPYSKLQLMF